MPGLSLSWGPLVNYSLKWTGKYRSLSTPDIDRITSYNVCYTKLLRNEILTKIYDFEPLNVSEVLDTYLEFDRRIDSYVKDISVTLHEACKNGQNILFEGAQGTQLDIDHGTYPFVTSSNTIAGNACNGSGFGPAHIDSVVGIIKAYRNNFV